MNEIILVRTNSENNDFVELIKLLDIYLEERDGDDHPFYAQYNLLDDIKYVIVAYYNGRAAGCGAIKQFDNNTMEIKRMFTLPEFRGKGIAGKILSELEKWSAELNFSKCILETGIKQTEAIALYTQKGYLKIQNYGQYEGVKNSLCFKKVF